MPPVDSSIAFSLSGRWCTSQSPRVSIIIVNWNAAALTAECIRHIWRHTQNVTYEIIVVDNGSSPEGVAALRNFGNGVTLIELGTNRFYGEANNIAVEHSTGEFLCFLNNDAFVRSHWLNYLVEQLEREPHAGAVGPLFLYPGSGLIQEAGGVVTQTGYPVRGSRGEPEVRKYELRAGEVDYISGATLLIRRDCFDQAGGFDLMYEPAYYEDADLCLKLRLLGRPVKFCPEAEVVHIEGAAANDDPEAERRRVAMGNLNRDKFLARWAEYLETRNDYTLSHLARQLLPSKLHESHRLIYTRTAALYTPYNLTPGGGERYLLTIASWLSETYETTIITPHFYSRHRLLNLGLDLQIDLTRCQLAVYEEYVRRPRPDQLVVLGNHAIPPIDPFGFHNVYVCQFPFPIAGSPDLAARRKGSDFNQVVTYSEYARAHVYAALSAHQMPSWPVTVIEPPTPQHAGDPFTKRLMILSVGRFFVGAHSKRHDLLIQAFRRLSETIGLDIEFHIAGSSTPDPHQMDYLTQLQRDAEGTSIKFHVNASSAVLSKLYMDAALYWHATGLGVDLETYPAGAEHFGIAIVEAMSAGCVPLAFNAGGPREIITHGVDGCLFDSLDELIGESIELLDPRSIDRRTTMGVAAMRRAQHYSYRNFLEKMTRVMVSDRAQTGPSLEGAEDIASIG